MNHDLLGFVLEHLSRRAIPWTEVARASGVPYDTLKKIAAGATSNPGVKHVQALAEFFDAVSEKNHAPTLAKQAQAAINTEAKEGAHE